jgi:hypothetical protein
MWFMRLIIGLNDVCFWLRRYMLFLVVKHVAEIIIAKFTK